MRKFIGILAILLVSLAGARQAKADSCNGVSAAVNLVSNCGFELGSFASWTGTSVLDPFSGVDTGDPLAIGVTPYNGRFEAFLGSLGVNDTLSQTLATTLGTQYTIEFALLNDSAPAQGYPNDFTAFFGTNALFTETNAPASAYKLYQYTATASSASTLLSFTSQNNLGDFELDSISVAPSSPAPEPSSLLLLGTGFAGLLGAARRRRPIS